jgi:hypothetical protein
LDARPLLAALLLCVALASGAGAQSTADCTNLRRGGGPPNMPEDLGTFITPEMARCARTGDSVNFVLAMGPDRMGPGIAQPEPQRLRIPIDYLDAQSPAWGVADGAVRTRGVRLLVPLEGSGEVLSLSTSITAPGWQDRVRASSDPEFGGRPGWRKEPPDASGLQRLIAVDPAKTEDRFADSYIANDRQFGFVQASCSGLPDSPRLGCTVSTELSPYLIVSVAIPEPQLSRWRELTPIAHEIVRRLLVRD